MATLVVRTPEGVALRYELAGAGSRFAAGLVDGLAIAGAFLAGALLLLALGAFGLAWTWLVAGLPVAAVLYQAIWHVLLEGRTPGKALLGLRVTDERGQAPDVRAHLLRSVLLLVDAFLPLPVPLGVYVILGTERRQRLGDLAAGTVVVREPRAPAAFAEPFPRERWSELRQRTLPLTSGSAARFGAADLDFLRQLWTRAELDPDERRRLFVDAARHYAARLEVATFADARVLLRELYLFLRERLGGSAAA